MSFTAIYKWTLRGKLCDCSTTVLELKNQPEDALLNPDVPGAGTFIQVYGNSPFDQNVQHIFTDTASELQNARSFCGPYGVTFSENLPFLANTNNLGDSLDLDATLLTD